MIRSQQAVEVSCTPQAAFAHIAVGFFENHSRWDPAVTGMTKTSEDPVGVGTVGQERRKAGGREMSSDIRITEFQPSSRFAFEATSGPLREHVVWDIQPNGVGSRIDMTLTFTPHATAMRVMEPVLRLVIGRNVKRNTERFRRALEEDCSDSRSGVSPRGA